MIYLDSRYADGTVSFAPDSRGAGANRRVVYRTWPNVDANYFIYYWVDDDRPDQIAARYLGDPTKWWDIMDLNPEILHPGYIAPGTPVRIPRVN